MPLPSVPESESLPLDAVASAAAAFGFRKLSSSYEGSLFRVRRASDNAEQDIDYLASGDIDIASLESFCAATDGFIVTWYDQSGNAANVTQATAGNQPQIVDNGSVIRESSRIYATFDSKTLQGTLGSSVASNSITAYGVLRNRVAELDTTLPIWLTILSGSSNCLQCLFNDQAFRIHTYATPGGSTSQTTDNSDVAMLWSRFAIAGITSSGSAVNIWRNDLQIQTFTVANTGASGTTIRLGDAADNCAISELFVYSSALIQAQISALYKSINAYHTCGPINPLPTVTLEERMPWDTVLRRWTYDLSDADRTVDFGAGLSWDGTYADTDELMRIYLILSELDNNPGTMIEGLMSDERWFRLWDNGDGYGCESTVGNITGGIEAPGNLRQFVFSTNSGSQAGYWAQLYTLSLPKAGPSEGNPLYQQRAVAVRALVDSICTGIQFCKEVDKSQDYLSSWDFNGGVFNAVANTYRMVGHELPLHVRNAYIEMLKYAAHRLAIKGARYANPNMEMKGVQAMATIYSLVDDAAVGLEITDSVKRMLFGSPSGTPDTTTIDGLYSNAGHIREGYSPETTYNGHSLFHLIGGLSLVRGDPEWDFLETVVDRMLRFKLEQYFAEPDGSFTGPSGYAGRTGGSRVRDQGFSESTEAAAAAFSPYARPLQIGLGDEASLISSVNAGISDINDTVTAGMSILTGTGLHTNGRSILQFLVTAQADPTNTLTATNHGLQNDDPVAIMIRSGGTLPGGITSGTTYYVINRTDNTFQISATEGGAAVTITNSGTAPFACWPAVYLGGSPNLSYSTLASCEDWVKGTYDGSDFIWRILAIDNTNKLLFVDGIGAVDEVEAVNWEIENGPRRWTAGGQHWVGEWISEPDAGYYDAQRALIALDDDTLYTPWELPDTFNNNRGDEFWLYKADGVSSSREFGWMIEALGDNGTYGGWYGGSIQTFWTRETGVVIQARHDKSGVEVSQDENTGRFQEIDQWATGQVWAKDTTDMRWGTAYTNLDADVTWDINGTPKSVIVDRTFTLSTARNGEEGSGEGGTGVTGTVSVQITPTNTLTHAGNSLANGDGIRITSTGSVPGGLTSGTKYFVVNKSGDAFQVAATPGGAAITLSSSGSGTITYIQYTTLAGTIGVNNTFEATDEGVRVVTTVTHSGATDTVKELWATIPVYLRSSTQAIADTSIQYWSGTAWNALTTTLTTTEAIRLGRNFGSGIEYVWIVFSVPTDVKLSDSVWVESYHGDGRYRNIKVDLLGYTGSGVTWPNETCVDYEVTSDDPGYVATEPSIDLQYPLATSVFPDGGIWGILCEVEWVDDPGTVAAEYTTNGSTWSSIGSLTNTTGNTWEYIGGTVPSGVLAVRVTATPSVGDPGTVEVAATSDAYTLVVEDNFTASNGTLIDASYTSWTTNTTGNVYQVPRGTIEVQSNQAYGTAQSNGAQRMIDCNATDNVVVECVTIHGTGETTPWGMGAQAWVSSNGNLSISASLVANGAYDFQLLEDKDSSPFVHKTANYATYSTSNPYRIYLQVMGTFIAARFVDINDGNSIAATLGAFTFVQQARESYGWITKLGTNGARIDDFKVSVLE